MTLTTRPLRHLDLDAERERANQARIFAAHPDPAVRNAAAALVAAGKVPTDTFRSTYGRAIHDSGNTSPAARRRDSAALAGSSHGWTRQAVHLSRAYDHALGWALTYGITVYTTSECGVHFKGLYELREEIEACEAVVIEAQRQIEEEAHMEARFQAVLNHIDAGRA